MKFNHEAKSFPEAIGVSEEQLNNLDKSVKNILSDMNNPDKVCKKSQIVELIAATMSYTDLVILATERIFDKNIQINKMFKKAKKDLFKSSSSKLADLTELALKKIEEQPDISKKMEMLQQLKDAITGKFKDGILTKKPEGMPSDIQSLRIDPTDIDGSLDRYNLPKDVKEELKKQIKKSLRELGENEKED